MKLYSNPVFGNSHWITNFLSIPGQPFDDVAFDLKNGEHKKADFLAMNPLGQVSVFQSELPTT